MYTLREIITEDAIPRRLLTSGKDRPGFQWHSQDKQGCQKRRQILLAQQLVVGSLFSRQKMQRISESLS